jgi:hypothetical protein
MILYVVLYGCETWSLTLRKEHRLKVFENRVLRRIFGPKSDEVAGEWRKLHNEELNDLYSSPSIIRIIKARRRWAGHVARMGRRGIPDIFVFICLEDSASLLLLLFLKNLTHLKMAM